MRRIILAAVFFVSACGDKLSTTAITTFYTAYDTAVAAEEAWLATGTRDKATVAQIATLREAAYVALQAATVSGATVTQQQAANVALAAFAAALAEQGVPNAS